MSDCGEQQAKIEQARDAAQAKREIGVRIKDLIDNAAQAILTMPEERRTYEHYRAEVDQLVTKLIATAIPWTRTPAAEAKLLILADYDPEGSIPAMITVNNVRFTSLSPKDKADEERINKAILMSKAANG